MKSAKKLSIALSLFFATSGTVLATTPISINPDGIGPDTPQTVGSLGWNNGFAISIGTTPAPALGTTVTAFGHGALANFNDANGNGIGGLGLNSAYEWTYVFGLTETLFSHLGVIPADTSVYHVTAGATNFFRLYYDPSRNSNILDGTGFENGAAITAGGASASLVLSGTFLPFDPATGVGSTTFTATGLGGNLDQFGANNYPGISTVAGNGSLNLLASVLFANPAFFGVLPPQLISITANGFLNLPFLQTNPSSCYFNGAILTSAVGPNTAPGSSPCPINTVGAINGLNGPNTAFETRVTSAFNATVPEPGSLALLGIGLVGLASFARGRRGRGSH